MWWEYPARICLWRLPSACVRMLVIKGHSYNRRCKSNNRWCSIDGHFRDGAGSVSPSSLPIKEANTSFMTITNRSPPQITHDTWPRIVDAPLMLIFKMELGVCHFLFCLWRQPIIRLWLWETCHSPDYPRYMTKNCGRSVNAHFQDGAGSVSLNHLPIQAANTLFMTICNLSPARLPRIHDQKLLTLRWR